MARRYGRSADLKIDLVGCDVKIVNPQTYSACKLRATKPDKHCASVTDIGIGHDDHFSNSIQKTLPGLWTNQIACDRRDSLMHWLHQGDAAVAGMILLSEAQMARMSPFFPLSHGVPRVDDRRVINGIIFGIRNSLRWRDVPTSYESHKTIYNRFVRWREMGVFGRIFVKLAKGGGDTEEIMIKVETAVHHRLANHWRGHLKAHRTAASLLEKGLFPGISGAQKAG